MIDPVNNIFLREVPAHLLAMVEANEFRVIGSIIQSASSGRIVGHLQETAALAPILSNPVAAVPQLAMTAVNIYQNEQIKAALEVLQSLQVANLALTGISIGVSVAGTAVLMRQILRLEEKVDAIMPALGKIARGIELLQQDRLAADFTRLRTLSDQVEEAWLPSATKGEWRTIAHDCHFLADNFERRARELDHVTDPISAEPFVEAYALASGLRLTARLAAGQDDMAYQAALRRAQTLAELAEPMRLDKVLLKAVSLDLAGKPKWRAQLDEKERELAPVVARSHQRMLAAAASVETLDELGRQGISGREWIMASRSEEISPVLFLPSAGSDAVEDVGG